MRKPFGLIRLPAMPGPDVWHAQASLGLYAVEPRSTATVRLNAAGLRSGDVAGLALVRVAAPAPAHPHNGPMDAAAAFDTHLAGRTTRPFAWLGVARGRDGFTLIQSVEDGGRTSPVPLGIRPVWLRAECDFVRNKVDFRYSTDGATYIGIGEPHPMDVDTSATQAMWCSPFSWAMRRRAQGGHADFDSLLLITESVRQYHGR